MKTSWVFFMAAAMANLVFLSALQEEKPFKLKMHKKLLAAVDKSSVPEVSKNFSTEAEDYVKKLEYYAINDIEPPNEALVRVDLNLLSDKEFVDDVVAGIDQEFSAVDKSLGEEKDKTSPASEGELPAHSNLRSSSLIFRGSFIPNDEFNQIVDEVVERMKGEMRRKKMDPLFFLVLRRGVVRHIPVDRLNLSYDHISAHNLRSKVDDFMNSSVPSMGGAALRGLLTLQRFGSAESRLQDENGTKWYENGTKWSENGTLVRSHFTFGPLDVDFVFHTTNGIRMVNSTVRSVAAHALLRVDASNNTHYLDFLMDSPLEHEIELKPSKNQRLRTLSLEAQRRLFKRDGRMEVRLQRCFVRASKAQRRQNRSEKRNI